MSDFARLHEKLAKLSQRQRAPGEGRQLKGEGAEALMAAFVTEIGETILPRRLIFLADKRAELHVAVAGMRLQALLSPAPDIEKATELADEALADVEVPGVAALKPIVAEFFKDAVQVDIQSQRLAGVTFGSDIGVPAKHLARAWEIEEPAETEYDPGAILGGFLSELGDKAWAWLRIEGEDVSDQGGDEARVEALGEQAAVFLDSYFSKFEDLYPIPADPIATVVASSAKNDCAILFIEAGTFSAFISVKSDHLTDVVIRWQSLVAE